MSQDRIIEFNQNSFRVAAEMEEGRGCPQTEGRLQGNDCPTPGPMAMRGDSLIQAETARSGQLPSEQDRALAEIQSVIVEIMKGNFGARANLSAGEKDKRVLKSFNEMLDLVLIPFRVSNEYFEKIANGDELNKIDENYPGELAQFKENINHAVESLANVVQESGALSSDISKGMIHSRANVSGHQGRWSEMLEKVNTSLDILVKPLEEIEKVMEHLVRNDFSIRVNGDYQGEYGRIKNNINAGIDNMASLMLRLRENANQLSVMSDQMAKYMDRPESASSDVISDAKTEIEEVKYVPDDQVVSDMKLYSEEIEKIVTIIDEIAAQISLLALNAAIECAASTENAAGLATIAEDIRKLAEKTTEADKRLGELIRNAHDGIQQAIIILSERIQRASEEQED